MVLLFGTSLDAAENIINPGAVLFGTVQDESQLWRLAHGQALQELMPDVAFGSLNGLERLAAFLLIALHVQEHARALAVRREHDLVHGAQGNPRVAQFALDDGPNLLLERLAHPLQVMLFATLLRHFTTQGKPLRISEKARQG